MSQENLQTMIMQNFLGVKEVYYGIVQVVNSKLRLMFCIIIESNSQKTFFSLFLCTNMAAMTSGENHLYVVKVCQ